MSSNGFSALFPPVYSAWLAERLEGEVLETLATCETCAMAAPKHLADPPTRDPGPFLAHLKCCTYFPYIPNFAVGKLLELKRPELGLRLRTAETQGLLLPLGLYATPERQALMEGRDGHNGFGQRPDLLCPFYDVSSEGCSIWANRPGVCTTYFCKSNRGADGLIFWADVERYLNHFEWTLANEVMRRLGMGENEIEMCKAIMMTEAGEDERGYFLQAAWGNWFGRKEEFFLEAVGVANQISAKEVGSLLDPEFIALETSLRSRLVN